MAPCDISRKPVSGRVGTRRGSARDRISAIIALDSTHQPTGEGGDEEGDYRVLSDVFSGALGQDMKNVLL